MHRAAPASRAFGRYAVGLPADPGHRRLTRRAQTTADNGQTTTNTTITAGLDRPRSFRNDRVDLALDVVGMLRLGAVEHGVNHVVH